MSALRSLRCGGFACRLSILLIPLLSLLSVTLAANVATTPDGVKYVETTTDDGKAAWLKDTRKPALYTQNFGDCLGSSLINVTRFDAAYYKDNMTVLFHLEGNTNVANESLMSVSNPGNCVRGFWLTTPSVYWSLCIRSSALRSHLQPMQCSDIQAC